MPSCLIFNLYYEKNNVGIFTYFEIYWFHVTAIVVLIPEIFMIVRYIS